MDIKICKCLVSNETSISNFQALEVVDRGSETQPQVLENLNKITRVKNQNTFSYLRPRAHEKISDNVRQGDDRHKKVILVGFVHDIAQHSRQEVSAEQNLENNL